MELFDIVVNLLVAGSLGALVGLERELLPSHEIRKKYFLFGGIRSYALISLLGAVSAYMGMVYADSMLSTLIIVAAFLAALSFIITSYIYSAFRQDQFGITSEFAAVLVFFIGVFSMIGERAFAVILGIGLAIIMSSKQYFKNALKAVSREELTNTLKFAVIAFVILPLLPDQKYSIADLLGLDITNKILEMPFFNPYGVWFFVVLMSGVSYVGYILSKIIGANKGIGVSGALGGLVSSTAVTSAMAEQSKKTPSIVYPFVMATIIAGAIMFVRVAGIVVFFNAELIKTVIIPVGIMLAVSGFFIGLFAYEAKKKSQRTKKGVEKDFRSPFQIAPALKFAAFILAIKFVSGLAIVYQDIWGDNAFYLIAFFSGFADVDAITQDMAVKAGSEGDLLASVATTAIIIAMMTNTFVKMMMAKLFGGKKFGNLILFSFAIILAAGGFSLLLI